MTIEAFCDILSAGLRAANFPEPDAGAQPPVLLYSLFLKPDAYVPVGNVFLDLGWSAPQLEVIAGSFQILQEGERNMKVGESFAGVATSATKVIEMYVPADKRLFDDPFAYKLLPFGWRVFLRLAYLPGLRSLVLSMRERRMPGSLGGILCRTRYIDDVLKRCLEEGIDQLVILGAGFDSRAYRIAGLDQVRVFEVDLPGTQRLKQIRVEKVLGAVPDNVTLLGMNFDQQDLDDIMRSAGFHKGKRTLFIWEGVTQYLTPEAVKQTLEFVSGVSGVGSAIVFTYVHRGLIDGTDRPEWFEPFLSFARRVGSPLMFGLDQSEVEQYLSDRGLRLIDDVGAADYQDLYLNQLGREMEVFEGERVAFAEVKEPPAT